MSADQIVGFGAVYLCVLWLLVGTVRAALRDEEGDR